MLFLYGEKTVIPKKALPKQPFPDVIQNRCSEKFRNIHRKTPVLETLFNKRVSVLKRDSNKGVFL